MLTKLLVQCDEERWALYYGVKGLGKDDPEVHSFGHNVSLRVRDCTASCMRNV